jgi:hypothetical protein
MHDRTPSTPHALAITDDAPPLALRSTRNRPRTAVRQGAGWTVHRRGSRCPTRPMSSPSSPSTVRLSGSLVRTRLSGRLVSSPSGVRPAGVRPAGVQARPASSRLVSTRPPCRIRLVPPQPGAGDGGHPVRRGNGHDWIESSSMWSGPVPGGSVDGPMRHRCRHRCGGRAEAGGGASAGGPGPGWCVGGRLRPTDQAGQTAARGVRRWRLRSGRGWLTRWCRTAPWAGHLAWSRDYATWSLPSLMSEWTGLEGLNELGGQDGARPQRGPAR